MAHIAVGALTAGVTRVVAIELHYRGARHIPLARAETVVAERLVGMHADRLSARPGVGRLFEQFMAPSLTAIGAGLALYALWLAFRPVVLSHRPPEGDLARARAIVATYGQDTLAYFALRDDKLPRSTSARPPALNCLKKDARRPQRMSASMSNTREPVCACSTAKLAATKLLPVAAVGPVNTTILLGA